MNYKAEIKVEYIPCPREHAAMYWDAVRTLYRLLEDLAEEEELKSLGASLPGDDEKALASMSPKEIEKVF